MINILKERWSDIVFFILLFIIALLLFQLFGHVINNNDSQTIYFLNITINNWLTIVTIFGLIIGGIWAIYQYYKNRKMKQLERATKIAQLFSDDLMRYTSIIDAVLSKYTNLNEILSKIIKGECSKFTIYELKKILSKEEIEGYLNYFSSDITNKYYNKYIRKNYPKAIVDSLPKKFQLFVLETLNKLEYICIDISSNAAGTEYIYESLHTSLVSTITQLYVLISSFNQTNVDVLYTNLKFVYNSWSKRSDNEINKLQNTISKMNKKIKKTEKKLDSLMIKLLDKKSHTV